MSAGDEESQAQVVTEAAELRAELTEAKAALEKSESESLAHAVAFGQELSRRLDAEQALKDVRAELATVQMENEQLRVALRSASLATGSNDPHVDDYRQIALGALGNTKGKT